MNGAESPKANPEAGIETGRNLETMIASLPKDALTGVKGLFLKIEQVFTERTQ